MGGTGSGLGNERIIWCMVGVAVYQVALWWAKSCQKEGVRRGGRIMVLPAQSGAKKDAIMPWIWKRGIIRTVWSVEVSA